MTARSQGQGDTSRHPPDHRRAGAQNWEGGTTGMPLCGSPDVELTRFSYRSQDGLEPRAGDLANLWVSACRSQGPGVRRVSKGLVLPGSHLWTLDSVSTSSVPFPSAQHSSSPFLERLPGLPEELGAHPSALGSTQPGSWGLGVGGQIPRNTRPRYSQLESAP